MAHPQMSDSAETTNSAPLIVSEKDLQERLARVKGFVIDMDGTLVLGDSRNTGLRALPGAADFIAYLAANGIPFTALTNGTVRPPRAYVPKLRDAGLVLDEKNVMTPSSVAADYLSRRKFRRVMVLGGEGVSAPLAEAGLEIVRPPVYEGVDAVYVGWFREFTMDDIEAACEAIWAGAKLFTASFAPFFATANGRTLGSSRAIIGGISSITGRRAKILGKPSLEALRCASRRLGLAPEEVAVIGDDPELEPGMARQGGAFGVGVTTGIAKHADFAAMPPSRAAHLVVENIGEFLRLYRKHAGSRPR